MPRFGLFPEHPGTNVEGTGRSGALYRFYITFVGCALPSKFAEISCKQSLTFIDDIIFRVVLGVEG